MATPLNSPKTGTKGYVAPKRKQDVFHIFYFSFFNIVNSGVDSLSLNQILNHSEKMRTIYRKKN